MSVRIEAEGSKITYTFKQSRNFWRDSNELSVPEIIFLIPEQFNESHKGTPRMRPVDNEALKKNLGDDLPESLIVHLVKEVKDEAAEPVGVCIGVTKV
jgi:hypothetical protein